MASTSVPCGLAFTINKLIRTRVQCAKVHFWLEETAIANTVPNVARRILERACDKLKLRANSNGECFGGEITESLREAGVEIGVHHIEILQTRSLLVRNMESLGEGYPAEILQDYDHRIPLSTALRFLNEAMNWTKGQGD
jgi:hypothetical protein